MTDNHDGGIREVELTPAQARAISVLILTHIDGNMDIQEPTHNNTVWVHFFNKRGQQKLGFLLDENGNVQRRTTNNLAF